MPERVVATAKTPESEQKCSSSCKQKPGFGFSGSPADRVLQLQRTAGNQAVQKLIKSGALQNKPRISQPERSPTETHNKITPSTVSNLRQTNTITAKEKLDKELLTTHPIANSEIFSGAKAASGSLSGSVTENTSSKIPQVDTNKKSLSLASQNKRQDIAAKSEEVIGEKAGKTTENSLIESEKTSIEGGDPGQILEQLKSATPTKAVEAYSQAQEVSATSLKEQKQQVAQLLPEIAAPTGLPANEFPGKEKGKEVGTMEKVPSSFEGKKTGRQGKEYKPEVQEAPPAQIKPTILNVSASTESAGSDSGLAQSAQSSLNNIQLNTDQVSTDAGKRPEVDVTGEADPSQVEAFYSESSMRVQTIKADASEEIHQDFGENNIFPEPNNETLRARKELSSPKILSVKGGKTLSVPAEAISGINQSIGPVLRERIGEHKGQYDVGKSKFDSDSANARADANKQIVKLDKDTRQKQIEEQNKGKDEVAKSRAEWQAELDNVEQAYQEKTGKATEEHAGKIAQERRKGEEQAAKHLDEAENKAEKEKLNAEKEASEKKKEANKESKGFWGWVKSTAIEFIEGLKKAINFIYDNLRKAVKLIFEAAKALAKAAIELARMAIVGLIQTYGAVLKGLVSFVFAAFPNIAKKIKSRIDKAINTAIKAVNKAAEYLKKRVEAVLDFLANTMDKLLGLIQSIYTGILSFIGKIISGELNELFEHIAGLISSAKQMPHHFWGQVTEELLGMNLAEPLPIERSRTSKSEEKTTDGVQMGALFSRDADLLRRPHLTENDVTVDNVEKMELDPEFVANLKLKEGQEVEFGESTDKSNSIEAIKAEILGAFPTQVEGSTNEGVGKAELAKTKEKSSEEELQELMAQEPKGGCAKEKQGEPAKESEVPEYMKRGPFTAGQRARYLVHQMKIGIKQWFACNWPWLLAGVVGVIAGVIALNILTGGAIFSALPLIMNIVTAVMVGVAIRRVMSYVGSYLSQGWAGNISSAAKSLARGLAIGAIELIFALISNLRAVIKSLKSGLKATVKATARAAKATVTTAIKSAKELGRLGVRAGKAAIKNSKLLMTGLKSGFSKGAKSLDNLAKRLWQQVRFKKFKIRFKWPWIELLGYINPWVVVARSELVFIKDKDLPPGKKVGDIVDISISGKSFKGELVGMGKKPPYRRIADIVYGKGTADSHIIHHIIEQQIQKMDDYVKFTVAEINAPARLIPILKGAVNEVVHLSYIRTMWDAFYDIMRTSPVNIVRNRAAVVKFANFTKEFIEEMDKFVKSSKKYKDAVKKGDKDLIKQILNDQAIRLLQPGGKLSFDDIISSIFFQN